jgi:hypothetical protein
MLPRKVFLMKLFLVKREKQKLPKKNRFRVLTLSFLIFLSFISKFKLFEQTNFNLSLAKRKCPAVGEPRTAQLKRSFEIARAKCVFLAE